MMERTCILGDSLTGAIAEGERTLNSGRNSATYFAANHSLWGDAAAVRVIDGRNYYDVNRQVPFVVHGNVFRPRLPSMEEAFLKSAQAREIAIDNYGGFVIAECTFSIFWMLRFFRNYRHDALPTVNRQQVLISEACFRAACLGILEDSWAVRTARMLRSVTSAPICLVAEPFANRAMSVETKGKAAAFLEAEGLQHGVAVSILFGELCNAIEQRESVKILEQPPETVQDHIFTREEFARRSGSGLDPLHCNKEWGRLVVLQIMDTIGRLDSFDRNSNRTPRTGTEPKLAAAGC